MPGRPGTLGALAGERLSENRVAEDRMEPPKGMRVEVRIVAYCRQLPERSPCRSRAASRCGKAQLREE